MEEEYDECVSGRCISVCMYVCMSESVYGCVCACMHACVCVCGYLEEGGPGVSSEAWLHRHHHGPLGVQHRLGQDTRIG